ncbi:hypothetical protein [Luteitalea sp. TBR-22]|uniref:alpha/beta hydrolase family protein n=1 Tax=Luteitalea sp. TBR-22 TaxID=2802971 RepID=UPI001EF458AF|nr:hypothetical protein [Luteitalea sp. TBR-22]
MLTMAAGSPDAQAATSLQPSGPHAVGRRFETWRDDGRPDPVDPARRREVTVTIWYPAEGSSTPSAELPLPAPWNEARLSRLGKRFGGPFVDALRAYHVSARTDAPLLPGTTRFPVLLLMPGLGWLPTDYSGLAEDLASHGYVVVGFGSPGFADLVRFPDGREVERTLGIGAAIGTDQQHVHEDARFVTRRIPALDADSGSPLRGRLDLSRLGAVGHSLGGTMAHVLAASEPTIRSAVNLDGDPMGSVLEIRPTRPLLLISSESPTIDEAPAFPSPEHRDRVREGLERSEGRRTDDWARMSSASPAAFRIRVAGTRHLNFPDAALFEDLLTTPAERWMKVGQIDGLRGLEITRALVRAFFAHTLSSGDDAMLQAPERFFPETRRERASVPSAVRPGADAR